MSLGCKRKNQLVFFLGLLKMPTSYLQLYLILAYTVFYYLRALVSATFKSSIIPSFKSIAVKKLACKCVLTKEEMKTFHVPLQGFPNCENFIVTKCNGSIIDRSPFFGLDCEEVLEQARVEVLLFPFNIVQLSFESFSSICAEEIKKIMKTKCAEMSPVYAGPFIKIFNVRTLKKIFNSLGTVQSITLVLETY